MKVKAVRRHAANDLRLEGFELPEILIKVISDSICMSTYKCTILGIKHKRAHEDVAEHPAVMVTHIGGLDAATETILNLPKIPGGKKLIHTHITMPLTAIEDFRAKGIENLLGYGQLCPTQGGVPGCLRYDAAHRPEGA